MKKELWIVSFTDRGHELALRIQERLTDYEISIKDKNEDLSVWTQGAFDRRAAIVFIGAMGIAVRTIAPFLKSKLEDSPVIVIDEGGHFAIPVVSGHVGGANRLAKRISVELSDYTFLKQDMIPVITTATDINDTFAADIFAMDNNLAIKNKDGIKKVSGKGLAGHSISIAVKDYPDCIKGGEGADIIVSDDEKDAENSLLWLCPKNYCIGIGCKKDIPYENVEELVKSVIEDEGISFDEIYAFASIDIKAKEEALIELSRRHKVPFVTFDAKLMERLTGDFSGSEFVKKSVGTDNVCEKAAVLCAGKGAKLIVKKTALNGVTVAVAKRRIFNV